MTPNPAVQSHDVKADIHYFPATPDTITTSAWKPRHLGSSDGHTRNMKIHNVRGLEDNFDLDHNGFQFVTLPEKERKTDDDQIIVREYYPELEGLAKTMTGATTVHVFHHAFRQHSHPSDHKVMNQGGRMQSIPSGHPHVDYCGVPELLEATKQEIPFPPPILNLFDTSSRFCFLNIWRPLKTVVRDPLAVADAMTVPEKDYKLRERLFRSGIRSGNYVMSHSGKEDQHKWYYMHKMKPHEVVVFKGYDTKQDLPGWRCPHTAFALSGTEGLPARESVEARVVCFWK